MLQNPQAPEKSSTMPVGDDVPLCQVWGWCYLGLQPRWGDLLRQVAEVYALASGTAA